MSAKLALVTHCHAAGVPIICAMGAGNKLDPTGFQVADLAKTKMDPLARVMRRELKKRGIHHLKVVYSEEPPIPTAGAGQEDPDHPGRRSTPGSVAFVPSVMGLILAGEVIKDLIKAENKQAKSQPSKTPDWLFLFGNTPFMQRLSAAGTPAVNKNFTFTAHRVIFGTVKRP